MANSRPPPKQQRQVYMRIQEIRAQNLNNLIAKFEQEEGSEALLRRFARHVGVGENHLSQIRNGDRGIGDELARKFEGALHLSSGWFDAEHADWTAETQEERLYLAQFRAGLRRLSPAKRRKAIQQYLKLVDTLTGSKKSKL